MNYFELYGLPETLHPDPVLLRKKWGEVSRVYHPDKYANAMQAERMEALRKASLNNEAYRTLKDEEATLAYILELHGVLERDEKYALPADFLMEMMDLNEAADDGQLSKASYRVAVEAVQDMMAPLAAQFGNGDRSDALLKALKDAYFRKKYLLRLKERLA